MRTRSSNTTVPNVGVPHSLRKRNRPCYGQQHLRLRYPPSRTAGSGGQRAVRFAMAAFDAINGASDGKAELAVTAPGLSEWLFYSVTGPGTSTIVGGGFHGDGTRNWDSDRGR